MIPLQSKFKGNAALVNRFKTPPFHGGMTGSTPVRGTKKRATVKLLFFYAYFQPPPKDL
jgi:hypothetical protein